MTIRHEQSWRTIGGTKAKAVLEDIEKAWKALGYDTNLARIANSDIWILAASVEIPWGEGEDNGRPN